MVANQCNPWEQRSVTGIVCRLLFYTAQTSKCPIQPLLRGSAQGLQHGPSWHLLPSGLGTLDYGNTLCCSGLAKWCALAEFMNSWHKYHLKNTWFVPWHRYHLKNTCFVQVWLFLASARVSVCFPFIYIETGVSGRVPCRYPDFFNFSRLHTQSYVLLCRCWAQIYFVEYPGLESKYQEPGD